MLPLTHFRPSDQSFLSIFPKDIHCVIGVHIQSFSGPYFPAFGQNTDRYEVMEYVANIENL